MTTTSTTPLPLPPVLAAEIKELDPQQREAATHAGNVIVIAGPGAGKTRTLVARVGVLLTTTSSRRGVAALTYTEAAADEMTTRLHGLGIRPGRRLTSATVHSFCLNSVLRPYAHLIDEGFDRETTRVPEAATCKKLMDQAAHESGLGTPTSRDRTTLNRLRRDLYAGESTTSYDLTYKRTVNRYEELLRENDLIDFEAMTGRAVALLRRSRTAREQLVARYPHIVVDEYQDLGPVLHALVEVLLDAGATVTAVGDPDQILFAYQGAHVRYLRRLYERGFHPIQLTLNYRSGSSLVAAGRAVLGRDRGYKANPTRTDAGTVTVRHVGGGLDEHAALAVEIVGARLREPGVTPESIAILYRAQGAVLDALSQQLDAAGVPYDREKHRRRPEGPLADLVARCAARALAGPVSAGNPRSTGRVPALPLRDLASIWKRQLQVAGIAHPDDTRRALARQLAELLDAQQRPAPVDDARAFLEALRPGMDLGTLAKASRDPRDHDTAERLQDLESSPITMAELAGGQMPGHIALTTYHSAKGREFSIVLLPGLVEELVPSYFPGRPPGPSQVAEARREFYVAITRAKNEAILIAGDRYKRPANRYYPAEDRAPGPTRFVAEIESQLV
ncbi:ATP-dependent helicase [Kitasatospora sp. NBC_01246]|uniref:ATP-dependent helicase n=1 Tax=Kitasatospora sp. NBC_01246 TaxID=2903570 RepID=UPI002E370E2E|nr:ATP-dependent helicase [Kitasatospora sp. NBC_01246]